MKDPNWTVITPYTDRNDSVPLNSTLPNLALLTSNWGTSWRFALTVATTAQSIKFDRTAENIRFKPSDVPTSFIFIKWHTDTITDSASATNFDETIGIGDPAGIQLWIRTWVVWYSIFSAVSQTVYTIEN